MDVSKSFTDVFPDLQLDNETRSLMERVQVTRVSQTPKKDFLHIYFDSDRLILKDKIWKLEKDLKKQLFSAYPIEVRIFERFQLSAQFTPEKLWEVYSESILEEIKKHSPVLYSILKKAKIEFPGGEQMKLELEDNVVVHSREAELFSILHKILNDRCGFQIQFDVTYREPVDKKEYGAGRWQQDVIRQREDFASAAGDQAADLPWDEGAPAGSAAGENAADGSAQAAPAQNASDAKQGKEKGSQQSGGYGKSFKKGDKKGSFQRGLKRSDNPDVVYGRDFEDDAVPIEMIQ